MDGTLVLCRFLQYGSGMLLFGVSVFQYALTPAHLAQSLDRSLRRVAAIAIWVIFLTAVTWLFLAAGEMGEGWSDVWNPNIWGAVLFDTQFGHVWQSHLGFAVGLVALVLAGHVNRWAVTAALSALLLGSLGFIGHAAMLQGAPGWLNRVSHALHLLAAGFWLGSLIPLVLCLGAIDGSDLRAEGSTALRRFSGLGHFAVATVIATGALNVRLVLGTWPINLSSPYQSLLLAKISVVAIMVGLAIVNRYVLVPRLKRDVSALRALRSITIAEGLLGLGAIGLVSWIGTLAPA